ncbi:MAG: branched-chain amino acid ABC transporter permease [Limnochordaceae bacterium]|nr:branched-chain amino acid ABC transporter permease [Limnochordaceae bacterium]
MLAQQLVNGLALGSVYALVALGYTMVYGVLRLINFAHGELFMLGAYLTLSATSAWGLGGHPAAGPLVVIAIGVAVLVAGVGLGLEQVAYRPLRRSTRLAPVVSALGASVFLQNAVMLTYGPRYQVLPENLVPSRSFAIGNLELSVLQLVILGVALVLMVGLYLFVQATSFGMAIRAVALDQETARLMGIRVDRVIQWVFALGPALGAVAGLLIGLYYRQINFTMGWTYGLRAFTAAILGGIGNIPGAMVGGLLLGVLEALASGYVSVAWKDAITFFVLILILIARPTGLLGERVAEKV